MPLHAFFCPIGAPALDHTIRILASKSKTSLVGEPSGALPEISFLSASPYLINEDPG